MFRRFGLLETFNALRALVECLQGVSFCSSEVQMGSPHKGEYQSQSQGIQGILKDMHDSFQRLRKDTAPHRRQIG